MFLPFSAFAFSFSSSDLCMRFENIILVKSSSMLTETPQAQLGAKVKLCSFLHLGHFQYVSSVYSDSSSFVASTSGSVSSSGGLTAPGIAPLTISRGDY